MKIKQLYFGIFSHGGEVYNHLLQGQAGKWCFFHVPRTRNVQQSDLREITEAQALGYIKGADRFGPAVLAGSLHCTGLELIEEKEE